jgi:heterodisulfide reductase subunit A-like polyferredoxin
MQAECLCVASREVQVVSSAAVVVGTGAAQYSAAAWLSDLGVSDVLMVTDRARSGTTRNAGSDKQT